MPRPSRLCSCTTIVTAVPDARISRARATALSSSGRVMARVEIFSEKIRVTPEARSESVWVSSNWRAVKAQAYPIRTCPAASALAAMGRASWVQAEPGLRSGGTGTLRVFARWGTSRNRAVWYWTVTLPRLVWHGEPVGAAQEDIGQLDASTRRKSSLAAAPGNRGTHLIVGPVLVGQVDLAGQRRDGEGSGSVVRHLPLLPSGERGPRYPAEAVTGRSARYRMAPGRKHAGGKSPVFFLLNLSSGIWMLPSGPTAAAAGRC
jgi:hypothetical protein